MKGSCYIKYTPVSDQFQVGKNHFIILFYFFFKTQISGATSPVIGINGDDCSLDYIIISGGGPTPLGSDTWDRSKSKFVYFHIGIT